MSKPEPQVHRVLMTAEARKDLRAIVRWIAEHDSPAAARHVLAQIERTYQSLAAFPNRGAYPTELLALGIRNYRQVFFKPYRIVYRVLSHAQPPSVAVLLIADARRDFSTLFQRRLLAQ